MNHFPYADLPVGTPIPKDPHAVTVSLPKWHEHNVAYEENDPDVIKAMQAGYPRFFLHPFYKSLRNMYSSFAKPGEEVWIFPSKSVATQCLDFVGAGRIIDINTEDISVIAVPQDLSGKAKAFWQHTGLIVSSRSAQNFIENFRSEDRSVLQELKEFIASLYDVSAEDIHLSPTGMGAIFNAFRAATAEVTGRGEKPKTIQLGFPYVDSLKIQEKFGEGIYVPYNSVDDLENVRRAISEGRIDAVICEVPGNPLLKTIDLQTLSAILKEHNIPLIIDDTLGPPTNTRAFEYADAVVTSLTKYFSGVGNVMGGSVVLNPNSPHFDRLKNQLKQQEELLYPDDAKVLLENAQGFHTRMAEINSNAEKLVEFLRSHPAVKQVHFPKGDDTYENIKKFSGGYGGLFSIELHNPELAPAVFDNLQVAKGPSLGTDFSLACPFTILAHYGELAWAEAQGVSRNLIRVAVGREPIDEIIHRFDEALKFGLAPDIRIAGEKFGVSAKGTTPQGPSG